MPSAATAGATENSVGLVLPVTLKVTVWPASSVAEAGPGRMAVAQPVTVLAPLPSLAVWSAPLVKVGGSLTAVIVIETVARPLSKLPSFTR